MNLKDILLMKNFDLSKKVKLVRHKDNRFDVNKLVLYNQLEIYQSYQSKPIFDKCDYIISFIGIENTKAKFYGIFSVTSKGEPGKNHPLPKEFIYKKQWDEFLNFDYWYDLKKVSGFDDLENRVIIDWGKSTLAWHQWDIEKEVIQILPKGYVKEFPGYLDFILEFKELELIYSYPDANKKWKEMLSEVNGIYLILDTKTGKQYIGSAYGENGIWGRWENYVKNGNGGNDLLIALTKNNNIYKYNFEFSILQTLPKSLTKNEVIARENFYKKKLGSRAFGLNKN